MLTDYNEASKGEILPLQYNTQNIHLNPFEAIQFAKEIHKKYNELLEHLSESEVRKILLKDSNIANFASENGFPKLFMMSTSSKTGIKQLEYLHELAYYRNEVNLGKMTEIEGEQKALEIAAKAKFI